MEVVVFGDIEVALADHLAAVLAERNADAPVFVKVPTVRPTRYVRVRRVGGPQINRETDKPRVVFECCDALGTDAHDLAALVRGLIKAATPGYIGALWVSDIIDPTLSEDADPVTGSPRYLVTTELLVTGTVVA